MNTRIGFYVNKNHHKDKDIKRGRRDRRERQKKFGENKTFLI